MKLYAPLALLLASFAAASTSTPVGTKVPKGAYADTESKKGLMPHSFLSARPLEQTRPRRADSRASSRSKNDIAGSAQVLYQMLEQRVNPSLFDPVIATIREDIRGKLSSTVQSVVAQLQAKVRATAACAANHGFDSGTSLRTAYNAAEQMYNAAVAALASSQQNKDTKCTTKDNTCRQRDDKGLGLYNVVRGSTQCSLPQQPADGTVYDETFVLNNVDQWVEAVEAQHTQWSQFKDSCDTQTAACAIAKAALARNKTAKTQKCSDLEAAKAAGKSAYDDCYNTAKGELDGYDWESEVTAQKSSVEQVETLICYIKVAVKDMEGGGSARKDGAIACKDVAQGQYQCTCTSNDGKEYEQTYDASVTVPTAPAKDTAWDTKGCPDVNSDAIE
jgi:hypothetical protein